MGSFKDNLDGGSPKGSNPLAGGSAYAGGQTFGENNAGICETNALIQEIRARNQMQKPDERTPPYSSPYTDLVY